MPSMDATRTAWRPRCGSCRRRACPATSSCPACSTACPMSGALSPSSLPIRSGGPPRWKRSGTRPTAARSPCRRCAPGADCQDPSMSPTSDARVAVVLKGWPRLSETFIAQEIAGLEARGVALEIWSLRRPGDKARHPVHDRVAGRTVYLPEHLKVDPARVLSGWLKARRLPGYALARQKFLADLRRDRSANRLRRWGQALVLAAELPTSIERLYAHFLHTPSSVTRYAAAMRGLPWSVSAHAKDIWTSKDWDVTQKLGDCTWLVTCTSVGLQQLQALAPDPARLKLVYHGLDMAHLPPPPLRHSRRDGSDAADPVVILSIGRRVEKKGYDDLLDALARLPPSLHWRFEHIGAGEL